ncbi:MAG: hypothetical protein QOE13_3109, partial [Gaiellaceae bacterium]|nr:hypothetical protein [Gaiellaceae bacterium]
MRPRSTGFLTTAMFLGAALVAAPADAAAPCADLGVRTLTRPPATAQPGQKLSIHATVANGGKAKAPASTLGFLLSRDGRADRHDLAFTATAKVKALAPGSRAKVTAKLTVPAAAGAGP